MLHPGNFIGFLILGCPSLERPLNVRLGRSLDVISELPQDVRLRRPRNLRSGPPHDGQIGSLEDVLGTLEGDVLGTSWEPIFAGWEESMR